MDTNNIISQLQDIMANAEHDSIRETIAQVCGISDMTDEQEQTIAAYEAEYLRVLRETSAMYPEDDGDSIDRLWQIMDQHVEDTAAALVKELIGRSYVKMKDQKPEFRYLVENAGETIIITDEFDNLEDANKHARYLWNHLTKDEKKTDTVQVLYVEKTEDYFEREILDSEDFEWSAWTNADSPEGGFDSSADVY
jgi:hypothetical protein